MYAIYIYGNMDPINIPPMLAYIPYMDPMGNEQEWNMAIYRSNHGKMDGTWMKNRWNMNMKVSKL